MKNAVRIEPVTGDDIPALQAHLRRVYAAAFAGPPHSETDADAARFLETLERHREREGFRCVVARAGDRLLGFGYGYTSRPGQWWHDLVAGVLRARDESADWLNGAFEVVTLAVHPDVQGRGIGGAVHDALLDDVSHSAAALSVRAAEAPALHLYRRRGWRPVIDPFYYPGGTDPFIIMQYEMSLTFT